VDRVALEGPGPQRAARGWSRRSPAAGIGVVDARETHSPQPARPITVPDSDPDVLDAAAAGLRPLGAGPLRAPQRPLARLEATLGDRRPVGRQRSRCCLITASLLLALAVGVLVNLGAELGPGPRLGLQPGPGGSALRACSGAWPPAAEVGTRPMQGSNPKGATRQPSLALSWILYRPSRKSGQTLPEIWRSHNADGAAGQPAP
jgi:hypothetical protein